MNKNGVPINLGQLRPGLQRDGGFFASAGGWEDGQHIRFYNGKPQRMEGISRYGTQTFTHPIRKLASGGNNGNELYAWNRAQVYYATSDLTWNDITPASDYAPTNDFPISAVPLFDESAGKSLMFYCKRGLGAGTHIFYHEESAASSTDLGITVDTGGITGIQPYLIVYDKNGNVAWSDANDYGNFSTGDAGNDYITSKPFIFGGPYRNRSALLWTADELWLMSYVGSSAVFSFNKVAEGFDILDAESIVQYGSRYYWTGTNCFYMFDGRLTVIQNTHNSRWFFDQLSAIKTDRPRVLGTPNYSWGEIWWAFEPQGEELSAFSSEFSEEFGGSSLDSFSAEFSEEFGSSYVTDPNAVLIFDVKSFENGGVTVWWDTQLEFHAGASSNRRGSSTPVSTVFGTTDGTNYRVAYFDTPQINLNDNRLASTTILPSHATTGPLTRILDGEDEWAHLYRIEPDFERIAGTVGFSFLDRKYAQTPAIETVYGSASRTTGKLDKRVQARLGQIKIYTDALNQDFSAGNPVAYMKRGDGNQGGT